MQAYCSDIWSSLIHLGRKYLTVGMSFQDRGSSFEHMDLSFSKSYRLNIACLVTHSKSNKFKTLPFDFQAGQQAKTRAAAEPTRFKSRRQIVRLNKSSRSTPCHHQFNPPPPSTDTASYRPAHMRPTPTAPATRGHSNLITPGHIHSSTHGQPKPHGKSIRHNRQYLFQTPGKSPTHSVRMISNPWPSCSNPI